MYVADLDHATRSIGCSGDLGASIMVSLRALSDAPLAKAASRSLSHWTTEVSSGACGTDVVRGSSVRTSSPSRRRKAAAAMSAAVARGPKRPTRPRTKENAREVMPPGATP